MAEPVFLHVCCAPCLDATLVGLAELGEITANFHLFFYNPNIHPLLEYRKRLKSVHVLNERLRLPLQVQGEYGLEPFLRTVWKDGAAGRCDRCYAVRLVETARQAATAGFRRFSSTLCVSPHQSHEAIRAAGDAAGRAHGVEFVYADLRPWREKTPPRAGLYHQSYCGCIFSENERYADSDRECYRGAADGSEPSGRR